MNIDHNLEGVRPNEVEITNPFIKTHMSLKKIAWILVIIGGLNWLLVGIGGFVDTNLNVVNLLLGNWPAVEWIVYIVVGLATVYQLIPTRSSDSVSM